MNPGQQAQVVGWIFVVLSVAFAISGIVLWRRSKPRKTFVEFVQFPSLFCLLGFLSWLLPMNHEDRSIGAIFGFAPFLFLSIGCFVSGLNAHLDSLKKQ